MAGGRSDKRKEQTEMYISYRGRTIVKPEAPIRVLQVGGGDFINRGVETVLLSYYQHIDRSKIQFDFLAPGICKNEHMRTVIKQNGGNLYEMDIRAKTKKGSFYRRFEKEFYTFLQRHDYKIVHVNTGSSMILALCARVAKRAKIPVRIVHSHTNGLNTLKHHLIKLICSPALLKCPTHYLACSQDTGRYTFPRAVWKKIAILPNAIDCNIFQYDSAVRREMRCQLGLENKHVVGNIGAFSPPKNHIRLIDIFAQIHKADPQAVLLLVGSGKLYDKIKSRVEMRGLKDQVIFYGNTDTVFRLYQAMDVFVLTSAWEGLGIVAIEAQAAGLKTICSDAVPKEAAVTELFVSVPLQEQDRAWASIIMDAMAASARKDVIADIAKAGYDIRSSAKELEDYYLSLLN